MSFENDILRQFIKTKQYFTGKTCLDIGTRNGLNCITMTYLGAKHVTGIDLDDSRFSEMPLNSKVTLVKINLFDMNESIKYDVITCFLWNMPVPDYTQTMLKIKSLLNPNGVVYIGVYDDVYRNDPYGACVLDLLKKHFLSTIILDNSSTAMQQIIRATDPK